MPQVVAVLQNTEHHTFPVTDDLATAMRAKADFQLEVRLCLYFVLGRVQQITA